MLEKKRAAFRLKPAVSIQALFSLRILLCQYPRIDFKVDYENQKVIPLSFENSFQGVYEEYDISDGKPETMKQINDILAFADDWMDDIEVQGYSPVTGDDEIEQTKDNISR